MVDELSEFLYDDGHEYRSADFRAFFGFDFWDVKLVLDYYLMEPLSSVGDIPREHADDPFAPHADHAEAGSGRLEDTVIRTRLRPRLSERSRRCGDEDDEDDD
jgi:hypothetical protein